MKGLYVYPFTGKEWMYDVIRIGSVVIDTEHIHFNNCLYICFYIFNHDLTFKSMLPFKSLGSLN